MVHKPKTLHYYRERRRGVWEDFRARGQKNSFLKVSFQLCCLDTPSFICYFVEQKKAGQIFVSVGKVSPRLPWYWVVYTNTMSWVYKQVTLEGDSLNSTLIPKHNNMVLWNKQYSSSFINSFVTALNWITFLCYCKPEKHVLAIVLCWYKAQCQTDVLNKSDQS